MILIQNPNFVILQQKNVVAQEISSYVGGPFIPKFPLFWSLFLFNNLVCLYVRKMTHYSVQPNNPVNILLKNPDIRIKRIIRLKP